MPKIAPPTDAAKVMPREFAIFEALAHGGEVDEKSIKAISKQYGCTCCLTAPTSFADFARSVAKPQTHFPEGEGNTLGLAAFDTSGRVEPLRFARRAVRPNDVRVQIVYCGMCHSDLHQVRNEWGGSTFPMVAGHEILGVVTEVGGDVTKFAVGDLAGIGCMVDACLECGSCLAGEEQHCERGATLTYNGVGSDGAPTQGGYSTQIVCREEMVVRIPRGLDLAGAAPLLCAGITMWTPLRSHGLGEPGKRVGIIGLGGLGHIGVRLAKAMGAHVTVISTSESKRAEAVERLGADAFVSSKDEAQMAAIAGTLDGIINTASAPFRISPYLQTLKPKGVFNFVGASPEPLPLEAFPLLLSRYSITGSAIGGIQATQEMIDFCAAKGIVCDVEVIRADQVNEAFERLVKNDVRYRFVIDIAGSLVDEGKSAPA